MSNELKWGLLIGGGVIAYLWYQKALAVAEAKGVSGTVSGGTVNFSPGGALNTPAGYFGVTPGGW